MNTNDKNKNASHLTQEMKKEHGGSCRSKKTSDNCLIMMTQ
ncbi:hypothetical protein HMPREF1425_01072 [Helicobacter pylori GAM71Ai]|nr:hypothetical protein HMPREF1425_01072 [Helicobacter pylori GAM71Ai]